MEPAGTSLPSRKQVDAARPVKLKTFNDSVHGVIELHPLSVLIIDTPEFQRLRDLKQLGGAYTVYPSASHNRFEHSLGVAHLARTFVRRLADRLIIENACKTQRNEGKEPGQPPEVIIPPPTEQDMLCVEIAGLIHDLGHGILSHMFDAKYMPVMRPERQWEHEHASLDMFEYLLTSNTIRPKFKWYNLDPIADVRFIKELVLGKPDPHMEGFKEFVYRGAKKMYLYEIVANKRNGIDVDKWDYFQRDARSLGVATEFGENAMTRLMLHANILEDPNRSLPAGGGELVTQISYDVKVAKDLYGMFRARWHLHLTAYQHRVSRVIEVMYTEALIAAGEHFMVPGKDKQLVKMHDAVDDMCAYSKLSDYVLRQLAASTAPELEKCRTILKLIARRKIYTFAMEAAIPANIKHTDGNPISLFGAVGSGLMAEVIGDAKVHADTYVQNFLHPQPKGGDAGAGPSLHVSTSSARNVQFTTAAGNSDSAKNREGGGSPSGSPNGPSHGGDMTHFAASQARCDVCAEGPREALDVRTGMVENVEMVAAAAVVGVIADSGKSKSTGAGKTVASKASLPAGQPTIMTSWGIQHKALAAVSGASFTSVKTIASKDTDRHSGEKRGSGSGSMDADHSIVDGPPAKRTRSDGGVWAGAAEGSKAARLGDHGRPHSGLLEKDREWLSKWIVTFANQMSPEMVADAKGRYKMVQRDMMEGDNVVGSSATDASMGLEVLYAARHIGGSQQEDEYLPMSQQPLSQQDVSTDFCDMSTSYSQVSQTASAREDLTEDDFLIDLVSLDYGKKNEDPINSVTFHSVNKFTGIASPVRVTRKMLGEMVVPQVFRQQYIRLYTKNPRVGHLAQAAFVFFTQSVRMELSGNTPFQSPARPKPGKKRPGHETGVPPGIKFAAHVGAVTAGSGESKPAASMLGLVQQPMRGAGAASGRAGPAVGSRLGLGHVTGVAASRGATAGSHLGAPVPMQLLSQPGDMYGI